MTGRVLVLGNASTDLHIPVPRLPAPGETLIGGALSRAPGGKGLNQAVVAARCGAEVLFCAALGRDADAAFVQDALRGEPLAPHWLWPGPPTDTSVLLVAPDAENCIISTDDCALALPVAAAEAFAAQAGPGDLLLMQGNLSEAATAAAARVGRARGAFVLLNTAPVLWPPAAVLAQCDGVVANAGEAAAITGRQGAAAAAALGPAFAVVTLGAAGCVTAAGDTHPPPPVRAVDSTGAGDVFCGVLAAALARGVPHGPALDAAQRAAADSVTRPGCFASFPEQVVLPIV